MTIEAFLTRELDIRFIDARNIATEAKINLGIHGYPNKAQLEELKAEACRIFESRPEEQRRVMRAQSFELAVAKSPHSLDSSSRRTSISDTFDLSVRSSMSSRDVTVPLTFTMSPQGRKPQLSLLVGR